jgi:D-xylose transport system substrate-binding protein
MELCPDCEVLYANAAQDATKQQAQAEAIITKGAAVLVLDAVDADAAATMVERAKQSDVPVIAYDRLISDADIDYYISFDNVGVTSIYLQGIDNAEIIATVHARKAPMIPASTGLHL